MKTTRRKLLKSLGFLGIAPAAGAVIHSHAFGDIDPEPEPETGDGTHNRMVQDTQTIGADGVSRLTRRVTTETWETP